MVARNQTLELHEILSTPYLLIIILTNDHNHKKQRNENMHVHHVLYMTPIGHPEASTLLFEMEKWSILPDGFMFESLIKGHCKICNMEAALTLFHEMERRGIAANLFCYTNLINGLCSKGRMEEASKLVEELLERDLLLGINTDSRLYSEYFRRLNYFFLSVGPELDISSI